MISDRLKFLIFNLLGLQLTWAACAYGASSGVPNLGLYVGITYIVLHFLLTKSRLIDLIVLLTIGSLGIAANSINALIGVISFIEPSSTLLLVPSWLMALWFVFSLMIPHSLYWLSKYMRFSFIAGAIGGSFSYWLGHEIGAIQLYEPLPYSVAIYFLEWGLIFPLALILTKYLLNARVELEVQQQLRP